MVTDFARRRTEAGLVAFPQWRTAKSYKTAKGKQLTNDRKSDRGVVDMPPHAAGLWEV